MSTKVDFGTERVNHNPVEVKVIYFYLYVTTFQLRNFDLCREMSKSNANPDAEK